MQNKIGLKREGELVVNAAIEEAIRSTNKLKLKEGDIVSHRDDLCGYLLRSVDWDNNLAIVEIPAAKSKTRKIIRKKLSLDGIFKATLAVQAIIDIKAAVALKALSAVPSAKEN